MPNHTTNILTVTGDAVEIQKMMDFVKSKSPDYDDIFSLQSIDPMPQELQGTRKGSDPPGETPEARQIRLDEESRLREKYGHSNWYDWRVANWQTKWDAYDVRDWEPVTHGAQIRFYTAWSPPLPVIAKLAAKFPTLTFGLQYSDEGMGYAGENIFAGTAVIEDYHEDAEGILQRMVAMGIPVHDEDDDDEEV